MLALASSVPFSMTGDSSLSSAPVYSPQIRLSMSKRANSVEWICLKRLVVPPGRFFSQQNRMHGTGRSPASDLPLFRLTRRRDGRHMRISRIHLELAIWGQLPGESHKWKAAEAGSNSSRWMDVASQFDTNPHSLGLSPQELRTQEFGRDWQSGHRYADGNTEKRTQLVLYGKQRELQKHSPAF